MHVKGQEEQSPSIASFVKYVSFGVVCPAVVLVCFVFSQNIAWYLWHQRSKAYTALKKHNVLRDVMGGHIPRSWGILCGE